MRAFFRSLSLSLIMAILLSACLALVACGGGGTGNMHEGGGAESEAEGKSQACEYAGIALQAPYLSTTLTNGGQSHDFCFTGSADGPLAVRWNRTHDPLIGGVQPADTSLNGVCGGIAELLWSGMPEQTPPTQAVFVRFQNPQNPSESSVEPGGEYSIHYLCVLLPNATLFGWAQANSPNPDHTGSVAVTEETADTLRVRFSAQHLCSVHGPSNGDWNLWECNDNSANASLSGFAVIPSNSPSNF